MAANVGSGLRWVLASRVTYVTSGPLVSQALMSFAKQKLKLAREAIGKKDFVKARESASSVLEYEPDNYNGQASSTTCQS